MEKISLLHAVLLEQWIRDGVIFKFWGDNVDKKNQVCDVRSDNQGKMVHMYSLLAGRSRIPGTGLSCTGQVAELSSMLPTSFQEDVCCMKKKLLFLSVEFSPNTWMVYLCLHTAEMSKKSEVVVLDVLKNKAKLSDMIDIMRKM